jgi:predicted dehydrogenase
LSSPPARVALLGYGLAGAVFHAPLIAAVEGLELAAIVTRNEQRRLDARRAHPEADLLDRDEQVWERAADFDLVVVASPNRTHVPLARAAIDAGIAVVVDKPLAASSAEARGLVDEALRLGVMLTAFQNRRWDGDFLTVRRLVDEGTLGRVLRMESRFDRWRPELAGGWRELGDPDEAGGLLYDLGSHLVDQALLLFGPVVDVYAELDIQRPGAQIDDDVFVALRHATGVRSHLWMSAVAAQPAPRFRLLGDRAAYVKQAGDVQEKSLRDGAKPGGLAWGEEPQERWGLLGAAGDVRPVPTEPGSYQRFYEGIVEALRGGPPPVEPADAVASLEVLEAARISARDRQVVRLEADR